MCPGHPVDWLDLHDGGPLLSMCPACSVQVVALGATVVPGGEVMVEKPGHNWT